MKKINTNRTVNLAIFFTTIVLFSSVGLLSANFAFLLTDKIYQGVSIDDIPVGGLSVQEAADKINDAYVKKLNENVPIVIHYKSKSWSIYPNDIDFTLNAADSAQRAYDVGRTGSIFELFKERYMTINYGRTVPISILYNQEKVHTILLDIAQSAEVEPINASLVINRNIIEIIPETIGQKVDLSRFRDDFSRELEGHFPFILELSTEESSPSILSKDLKDLNGIISSYTTEFDPNNRNRVQNITLAAKSLDGILVKPGEVVSFNDKVGLRLEEYGYKEAPVFIEGKLVPDWGGGVCQVSSTLYNAVLLADLGIEERTSHFSPPGYVPVGMDATVADNLLDFRFKNTLNHSVYLKTELAGNRITIYIVGKYKPSNTEIKIIAANKKELEPNTVVKQDPDLEFGKQIVESAGQKGFQVTTYRIKIRDGKEVQREFLAYDEFSPDDRVIRIGTKITDGLKK